MAQDGLYFAMLFMQRQGNFFPQKLTGHNVVYNITYIIAVVKITFRLLRKGDSIFFSKGHIKRSHILCPPD